MSGIRKMLVRKCRYSDNPLTGAPLFCDAFVILDEEHLLLHESLFLCDLALKESFNSIRSYASDLVRFTAMAKLKGGWAQVDQRSMTGYLHGELYQRAGLAQATIARHIETLKKFYLWLYKKGFTAYRHDFDWSYIHLYSRRPSDKTAFHAMQHSFNTLYISENHFQEILSGIRSGDNFIESRNEITLRFGYECGLRAHEVVLLKANELLTAICSSRQRNNGLWATSKISIVGKGSASRDIYVPPSLSEKVYEYILNLRPQRKVNCEELICTRNGTKICDPKFASTTFSLACRQARITRVSKQGYHMLRKSFGTNLVSACYKQGRDPWVEVPRRMGHKNVRTTMKYIQFDALLFQRSDILSDLSMRDEKYAGIQSSLCREDGI